MLNSDITQQLQNSKFFVKVLMQLRSVHGNYHLNNNSIMKNVMQMFQ